MDDLAALSMSESLDLVYIYEMPEASPDAREWYHGIAVCACGHKFMAVFHMPTFQKQGRLRCPSCLRYQAAVPEFTDGGVGGVH